MLQNIRDNAQGMIAKFIIGIIVVSFAFFGVESLIGGRSSSVASVNGKDITPNELNQAMLSERNRRMNMMGEDFDPSQLAENVLHEVALEQLIQKSLLLQVAEQEHLGISEQHLGQIIGNMQQFQENGVFSKQLFQNVLSSNGLSQNYFMTLLRSDVLIGQLSNGITGSEFVTPQELETIAKIVGQKRSFKYLMLPKDQLVAKVEVTDDEVQAYFDTHTAEFMTEDRVKIEYLEVKQQDFFQPVSEDDLKAAYQTELEEFTGSEERRASHILVSINDSRSAEQALAEAKKLKAKLDGGEAFASLAKAESDDKGSAGNGGDLGFTSGETFPPEFEKALFALPLNGVSDPVLTDAGYHLVKATEINALEKPSFEDRKPILEQRLMLSASESEFVSAVEELRDLVFNSDGLKGPAKELGLSVATSDWLSHQSTAGVLSDPRILSAAFSDDVLKEGNNSEVIELAEDHFIVVHVIDHDPPHKKDLAEVDKAIRTLLIQQKATERVQQIADSAVASLKAGEAPDTVASKLAAKWNEQQSVSRSSIAVNRELLASVFSLSAPEGEDRIETVTLANGDVAVVILSAVSPGALKDFSKGEQMAMMSEIQKGLRAAGANNFMTSLRDRAEIETF